VLVCLASATTSHAIELASFWEHVTAPFTAHHHAPPPAAPSVRDLAARLDWLEQHLDTYGSIVVKHPDVWGQSRLMRHRHEYEEHSAAAISPISAWPSPLKQPPDGDVARRTSRSLPPAAPPA
jgi:hypothetical protein